MNYNGWDIQEWEQTQCTCCGRMRTNLSANGLHLCEKCDYCFEVNRCLTDEELEQGFPDTDIE